MIPRTGFGGFSGCYTKPSSFALRRLRKRAVVASIQPAAGVRSFQNAPDSRTPAAAAAMLEVPEPLNTIDDMPSIHTVIPGPKKKAAAQQLSTLWDAQNVNMVVDYEKCSGNFIVDADGNKLLDCFAQIASIPLGYNNPKLIQAAQSPEMIRALVNRPALGNFPGVDWMDLLQTSLMKAAPRGMTRIFTGMNGSDANETAYKAARIWAAQRDRGGNSVEFSDEENASAMLNQAPGSSNYSIMSFKGGFHGRLFGSLSTTRSKPIHKLDIPAFDWPCGPFPQLKYPLDVHSEENMAEEQRCLVATEQVIQNFHNPVAAVVIEPIQSEGGDNHASPAFFQGLRDITLRNNVLFIVDEVQTGVGATGKFWAHDHWNLQHPPDMVTFSKKAQAAGYYYRDDSLRPNKPYRQFNTWMGDPARAILFRAIFDEIEARALVRKTAQVGAYLYSSLEDLSKRFPTEIQNLRGKDRGTFIAFDSPRRDAILKEAKQMGVNLGGSGERAIRLRPMLIFEHEHADILLRTLYQIFSR